MSELIDGAFDGASPTATCQKVKACPAALTSRFGAAQKLEGHAACATMNVNTSSDSDTFTFGAGRDSGC